MVFPLFYNVFDRLELSALAGSLVFVWFPMGSQWFWFIWTPELSCLFLASLWFYIVFLWYRNVFGWFESSAITDSVFLKGCAVVWWFCYFFNQLNVCPRRFFWWFSHGTTLGGRQSHSSPVLVLTPLTPSPPKRTADFHSPRSRAPPYRGRRPVQNE